MTRRPVPARRAGVPILFALLAAAAGCEKPRGDVSGSVTYRGKPVVSGAVNVIGVDQMTYYGAIQPDGTFGIRGVPAGPVRLGVYSPDPYFELPVPPAVKAKMDEARRKSGQADPPKPPKGTWYKIPAKYTDPATSGLAGEVTAPACTIDCRLE